jgi:hypothetical protein
MLQQEITSLDEEAKQGKVQGIPRAVDVKKELQLCS